MCLLPSVPGLSLAVTVLISVCPLSTVASSTGSLCVLRFLFTSGCMSPVDIHFCHFIKLGVSSVHLVISSVGMSQSQ